jgi:hypothetical protein
MHETIKIHKKDIESIIEENSFSEFLGFELLDMQFTQSAIFNIKKEFKFAMSELNHLWDGSYVFICQDNNAFLYGLYKGEDSKIYIVKSFMDSIISVVRFERKLLYRN